MKQGLNFNLAVSFDIDLSTVEKIEFVFLKENTYKPQKKEVYPGTVIKKESENVLLVPFSREETYKFSGNFYMDTRITIKGISDQPETPIISLEMNDTLFERNDT